MRCVVGSRADTTWLMWSYFLLLVGTLAAAFWCKWSFFPQTFSLEVINT